MVVNEKYQILSMKVAVMPAKGKLAAISRKKYGWRANERDQKILEAFSEVKNHLVSRPLLIKSDLHLASVSFNEGKIVDADANGHNGKAAFREIIEISSGIFEFSTTETEFAVIINISSNTNFLLDVLTELDNERAEKQGLRTLKDEDL